MSDYKITVTCFKDTGKFYTTDTKPLKPEHQDMPGFKLQDLFERNDSSVQDYSGVSSGFSGDFYYVIDVSYPDDVPGFCTFLLNRIK